jgi:hypothetical protein
MNEQRRESIGILRSAGAVITVDTAGEAITLRWGLHAPISDAGLARVGTLTSLREVELAGMTDDRVGHLAPLTDLTHLSFGSNMFGSDLSDRGLTRVGDLASLETLLLPCPRLTDVGIASLERVTRLKSLSLSRTGVTLAGLRRLAPLEGLVYIDVPEAVGLEYVGLFPRLETVYDFGATDPELDYLGSLPRLKVLGIESSAVTDSGGRFLARLTTLQQLYLYQTKITEAGFSELRRALPNCQLNG